MQRKVMSILLCALMFATVFIVEAPANVITQVTEEWVARYNSPENRQDVAEAIAIAPSGNIYVTGDSYNTATWYDYLTIAYDSSGNELWVARYDGLENRHDHARAIATDSSGNVYVTGSSDGNFTTIAYDVLGNELWVARYNGPGNGQDNAGAIAAGSSGNVYVTGRSWGGGTGYDYTTVAYDSSGNELWVARYDGPGNSDDGAADIAVDSSENVYVTGDVHVTGLDDDYVTIAYDTLGNELWIARYSGPENKEDVAYAITADLSGNVYVTGKSYGGDPTQGGTSDDYVTVAYDSSGNEFWVARYNGPGNSHDMPYAMAADSSGNVYVTGRSSGNGTHDDYVTVAYDSSGNELWVARYNGPGNHRDYASDITLDSFRNVYVTGWSDGGVSKMDYATVAYDSSGNELWVARYNSVGNGGDRARGIAVDSSGNVYVTGDSLNSGTWYDYVTIKYSQESRNIQATIDIDPDTLNLKSKGKWITAYIELEKGYDVNEINISSILLEDVIPAEKRPLQIGDYDGDGIPDLMVKFDRSEVEDILTIGDSITLAIKGNLVDNKSFEGSDLIRVIRPPMK